MKKEFKVEGMMCNHCRIHVEKALNSMEGVHATVTLNPPVAAVELSEGEKTLDELQAVVTAQAGDYTLKEKPDIVYTDWHYFSIFAAKRNKLINYGNIQKNLTETQRREPDGRKAIRHRRETPCRICGTN